jgi:uncharacterized tellurite resistance protein B-like protein
MHIVIAILGAIAAAFWAFTYFVGAARQGQEALRDAHGAFRGAKWSRRVGQRLVENLSDPREAAAVLLFQVAAYDGAVTDAQRAAIVSDMKTAFGADDETAEGLFAFARAATGQINDAANSLKKIVTPIAEACTQEERRQLIDMMLKAAEIEGPASDVQNRLISETRRLLSPVS